MHTTSRLLEIMIGAARQAGAGLKEDFAHKEDLSVRDKNGAADPVTSADLRSEGVVRELLDKAFPDYGFLGEEGGLTKGRDERTWIVDPLDGTGNFLCGVPAFAVSIALARGNDVLAGVTYAPMLDELFYAEKGAGAFLNGAPIRISSRQGLEHAMLGVGLPFAGKPRLPQFLKEMERLMPKVFGVRRWGAGTIDLAYVACGRYDAYWEQSVAAWDIAAGVVLVQEAGGVACDTLGRPLALANGTVLGCTPQLRPALLEALSPIDDGKPKA
jgi:myo-inositol-1(or 4)-monophosphatase